MSIEAILIKALLKFLEAIFKNRLYRAFVSIEAVLSFLKLPLYADFFVVTLCKIANNSLCNLTQVLPIYYSKVLKKKKVKIQIK